MAGRQKNTIDTIAHKREICKKKMAYDNTPSVYIFSIRLFTPIFCSLKLGSYLTLNNGFLVRAATVIYDMHENLSSTLLGKQNFSHFLYTHFS